MTERPAMPERSRESSRQAYQDPLQVYADADAQTRAVIEKELDRVDLLDQRDAQLHARGLNYGVVVTLAFLFACVYLIASGHGVEGTVLGVMFIAALVAVLVVGRRG